MYHLFRKSTTYARLFKLNPKNRVSTCAGLYVCVKKATDIITRRNSSIETFFPNAEHLMNLVGSHV